jgi:PEP-CTERM motif
MRKLVLSVLGASALAIASAASAQTIITPGAPLPPNDPTTVFVVSGNIFSGPISATIGHTGIAAGDFTDIFQFTIPQDGFGSGALTTTIDFGAFGGAADLDITSVVINGVIFATETLRDLDGNVCLIEGVGTCGATETFASSNVPITSGVLNTIRVTGLSRGLGSYGGSLTFSPTAPVPEPATWGMMLIGFAGIGWQLRRTRRTGAIAQLA